MDATSTATQRAMRGARQAEGMIEADPLPVRHILLLLIQAVIALAHAVIRLEDAAKGGR